MSPPIVVRACSSPTDCALVAKLCGDSFPEECHGQGLSVTEWQQIEAEELSRTPSWWRQIGAAGASSGAAGRFWSSEWVA